MLEKLLQTIKELFKAKGIELGDNEDALKAELEKVIKETKPGDNIDLSKLDLSKFNSTDNGKVLEAVINNQTKLEAQVSELVKYMKDEADLRKSERERLETDKKAKLEADAKSAVDYLINVKKAYPESKREALMKVAMTDLENFKAINDVKETDKHFADGKDGQDGKDGGNDKPIARSTMGNANLLKIIQEHQAQGTAN